MSETQVSELDYRIIESADISDDLDRSIRETLVTCFKSPEDKSHFAKQRWWHSRHNRISMAVDKNGTVVSSLCVVERRISVGDSGTTVTVMGIGNVCTLPEWRGKGVIDRVMSLAVENARERNIDAGLLFCKPALIKVYGRMGWETIDVKATMQDEAGNAGTDKTGDIFMVKLIQLEEFPAGNIDLNGRDW